MQNEKEWIEDAVRKFRNGCLELQNELSNAASGPIESSCKNVVQQRMKGCGMRWSRKGASAMLEVRCALYSDIWEDVVKKCA